MSAGTPEDAPNYHQLSSDRFTQRVADLKARYAECDLCAYDCGVNRSDGEIGACQVDDTVHVSSYFPHFGEEDCLRGWNGSGTIFLANCNMKCVFCQNFEVSQQAMGEPVTTEEIADMALELQDRGCHNINFVSPTHHSPHLIEAVQIARERGLSVPLVWNCGGYERPAILEQLDGIVDIYMPDVKWSDNQAAVKYSKAPNYWETVRDSLREMHRQVGTLEIDDRGLATGGLLGRHLVMPDHVENAGRILEFIAEELSPSTFVNLMAQYQPYYKAKRAERYEAINREITVDEYDAVVNRARELGLERITFDPGMLREGLR